MLTTVYSLYGPVMKLSLHFLHFLHFHHLSSPAHFVPARLLQTASVHPPGTRLGVLQVPCTGTRTDIVNTQAAQAAQTAVASRTAMAALQAITLPRNIGLMSEAYPRPVWKARRIESTCLSQWKYVREAGTGWDFAFNFNWSDSPRPEPMPGQFCNRSKANCHCFWLRQAPHSYCDGNHRETHFIIERVDHLNWMQNAQKYTKVLAK